MIHSSLKEIMALTNEKPEATPIPASTTVRVKSSAEMSELTAILMGSEISAIDAVLEQLILADRLDISQILAGLDVFGGNNNPRARYIALTIAEKTNGVMSDEAGKKLDAEYLAAYYTL